MTVAVAGSAAPPAPVQTRTCPRLPPVPVTRGPTVSDRGVCRAASAPSNHEAGGLPLKSTAAMPRRAAGARAPAPRRLARCSTSQRCEAGRSASSWRGSPAGRGCRSIQWEACCAAGRTRNRSHGEIVQHAPTWTTRTARLHHQENRLREGARQRVIALGWNECRAFRPRARFAHLRLSSSSAQRTATSLMPDGKEKSNPKQPHPRSLHVARLLRTRCLSPPVAAPECADARTAPKFVTQADPCRGCSQYFQRVVNVVNMDEGAAATSGLTPVPSPGTTLRLQELRT